MRIISRYNRDINAIFSRLYVTIGVPQRKVNCYQIVCLKIMQEFYVGALISFFLFIVFREKFELILIN